jgi:raffinose/stachyose/melibiose transport system permease protein
MGSLAVEQAAVDRVGGRRFAGWTSILLFLAPALAFFALLVLVPILQAGYYSLFRWNGLGPPTEFVGLANYQRAIGDPTFRSAIAHNGFIMLFSLMLQIPFALGLALMLNGRFPGRSIFRLLFFAPFVISQAITGVVFQLMLVPRGLVDRALEGFGLGFLVQPWLAEPSIVLSTLFVIISWKYFGFHMILLLAGLQGIPRELEEAAAIDGATRWQAIRHISLPLLGPTIRVSVFLSIIGSLQVFDLIWVMTEGGPVNASNTMATYMIDWGFRRSQLGYGSAAAVILFVIAMVLALAYQRVVLRRDTEGAVTSYG